jgi:hypothetical protein
VSRILDGPLDDLTSVVVALDHAVLLLKRAVNPDSVFKTVTYERIPEMRVEDKVKDTKMREISRCGFIEDRPTRKAGRDVSISRWDVVMSDYPEQPWDIHFDPIESFDEADDEYIFFHPYNLDTIKDEDLKTRIVRRVATETRPGGELPLNLFAFALRLAIGWDNYDNIPLRMLSYYIKQFGSREPFIQGSKGTIDQPVFDSSAAIRIYYLISAACTFEGANALPSDPTWWLETLSYVLYDVNYRVKELKSMTGDLFQGLGSGVRPGDMWTFQYEEFDVNLSQPAPTAFKWTRQLRGDNTFYAITKPTMDAKLVELRAVLPRFAHYMAKLIVAIPSEESIRLHTLMKSPLFWSGYTRGQTHLAHEAQYQVGKDLPDKPYGSHPWGPYIHDSCRSVINHGLRNRMIKSYPALRATFASSLKATASGGDSFPVTVEIADRAGGVRGFSRNGKTNELRLKFSDKKGIGLSDPESHFDPKALMHIYTVDHPGVIGGREVPGGKAPRAISNVRSTEWNWTRVIGDVANHYVNSTTDRADKYGPADYVAGNTTGITHYDDFWSAAASGDPNLLPANADYTAFDSTQKESSSRVYQSSGYCQALSAAGYAGAYGPWATGLVGLTKVLFGKGVSDGCIFISGRVPEKFFTDTFPGQDPNSLSIDAINVELKKQKIKARYIYVDSLRSGELTTLASNSLNNMANYRVYDALYDPTFIRWLRLRIQGDDSNRIGRMEPGEALTTERYNEIVSKFVEVSEANGLLINPSKFVMRFYFTEFLQITWYGGAYYPKPIIQLQGSEKPSTSANAVGILSSLASKYSTAASRGMDDRFLSKLLIGVGAFLRAKKNPKSFDMDSTYFPPLAVLWTPKKHKGVGMYPGTVLAANPDTAIVIWLRRNPENIDLVEKSMGVYYAVTPSIRRTIAGQLATNSPGVTPADPFKAGKDFIRATLPQSRINSSNDAIAKMKAVGVDLTRWSYERLPQAMVMDAISSNKQLLQLDALQYHKDVPAQIRAAALGTRLPYDRDFKWLTAFSFSFEEVVVPALPDWHPYSGLAPRLADTYRQVGFLRTPDAVKLTASSLLHELKKDPFFRGDIRESTLLEVLSDPKISMNVETVQLALMAMGASASTAGLAAAKFINSVSRFTFMASLSGASISDAALGGLDMSRERLNYICSMADVGMRELNDMLTLHCGIMSVMECITTGTLRRVRIHTGRHSLHRARSAVLSPAQVGTISEYIRTGLINNNT